MLQYHRNQFFIKKLHYKIQWHKILLLAWILLSNCQRSSLYNIRKQKENEDINIDNQQFRKQLNDPLEATGKEIWEAIGIEKGKSNVENFQAAIVKLNKFNLKHKKKIINKKSENGNTLLNQAIQNKDEQDNTEQDYIIDVLLKNHADINQEDKNYKTPFDMAIDTDDTITFEKLLKRLKQSKGKTFLMWDLLLYAIQQDKTKHISLLIDYGVNINKQLNDMNITPLSYAVLRYKKKLIEFLIEKGAKINLKDKDEQTPLHYAATIKEVSIMQCLLDHNENNENIETDKEDARLVLKPDIKIINARNQQGKTPLCLAIEYDDTLEIATLLLSQYHADPNIGFPLHIAIQKKNNNAIALLLNNENTNLNIKDHQGNTPLHVAAKKDNDIMMKLLLEEKDADPNISNSQEQTPLNITVKNQNLNTTELLLEKGADPNIKNNIIDYSNNDPLRLAIENRYLDITKLLLKKGAKPNTIDNQGNTPLHLVVQNENDENNKDNENLLKEDEFVKLLLENGADPSIKNKRGYTPSYFALKKDNATYFTTLANNNTKNLDENFKTWDTDKLPLLHYAIRKQAWKCVEVIAEHIPNINILNRDKQTALDYATYIYPAPHIIETLKKHGAKPKKFYLYH